MRVASGGQPAASHHSFRNQCDTYTFSFLPIRAMVTRDTGCVSDESSWRPLGVGKSRLQSGRLSSHSTASSLPAAAWMITTPALARYEYMSTSTTHVECSIIVDRIKRWLPQQLQNSDVQSAEWTSKPPTQSPTPTMRQRPRNVRVNPLHQTSRPYKPAQPMTPYLPSSPSHESCEMKSTSTS